MQWLPSVDPTGAPSVPRCYPPRRGGRRRSALQNLTGEVVKATEKLIRCLVTSLVPRPPQAVCFGLRAGRPGDEAKLSPCGF